MGFFQHTTNTTVHIAFHMKHFYRIELNDRLSLNNHIICERTGKELPGSVMLMTRFTRVTP